MNICFVTPGPIEWASSRLRAYWVADALRKRGHNVTVINSTKLALNEERIPDDVNAVIWLKQVIRPHLMVEENKKEGVRHYWDLCDPMHWFDPSYAKSVLQLVDGVVCSNKALTRDIWSWYGLRNTMPANFYTTIPDRLDMSHFPEPKVNVTKHGVTRFIWYGIAANRQALYSTLANLERLKANGHSIELTIYDDRPDAQFTGVSFPVYHSLWNLKQETLVISSHDIALLPPYPGAWGKVKSNNKKLTAWACGVPVTDGQDYNELSNMVDNEETRKLNVMDNMTCYNDLMTIENSAKDWEAILC